MLSRPGRTGQPILDHVTVAQHKVPARHNDAMELCQKARIECISKVGPPRIPERLHTRKRHSLNCVLVQVLYLSRKIALLSRQRETRTKIEERCYKARLYIASREIKVGGCGGELEIASCVLF